MKQTGAYLAWMGVSVLLTFLWYALAARKAVGNRKAWMLGGLALLLGTAAGLLFAHGAYWMFHPQAILESGWTLITFHVEEMSYYGGMAGVCVGVWLAARILGVSGKAAMRLFAPIGCFLAAMSRFGEGFLGMYGVGRYLEESFFPVAVRFTWDGEWFEYYLAVFLYEGLFSLTACELSLKHREEKDRFVRTLFYLLLPQILLESLRIQSITWLFVRVEQLLCFLVCEGICVSLIFRIRDQGIGKAVPALTGLFVAGLTVAGEFALDGKIGLGDSDIPPAVIYAVIVLALAVWIWTEHRAHRLLPKPVQADASGNESRIP